MRSERRFDAIIFDMDGVLADSEPYYHRAINAVLAKNGYNLSDEAYQEIIGFGVEEVWVELGQRFKLERPLDESIRQYNEAVLQELRAPTQPNAGVEALIQEAKHRRIRLGLASSSLRAWVEALLEGIGLRNEFEAIVTGEMVKRHKPAPDPFLLAARKLGVEPARCLAIEDSPAGVQSAASSSMYVIAVRTQSTEGLTLNGAHTILDSLEQFDLTLLD